MCEVINRGRGCGETFDMQNWVELVVYGVK